MSDIIIRNSRWSPQVIHHFPVGLYVLISATNNISLSTHFKHDCMDMNGIVAYIQFNCLNIYRGEYKTIMRV